MLSKIEWFFMFMLIFFLMGYTFTAVIVWVACAALMKVAGIQVLIIASSIIVGAVGAGLLLMND